ncbi:LuxR C-terminal-related transcriptional regulator [Actinokineospora soli]|uniref:LuxR C-terminal-related transcriptional regulator n=1 Tax=Actinokineospora soli TaxID=1048753 RepID=A0ABW2TU72_9PSEU
MSIRPPAPASATGLDQDADAAYRAMLKARHWAVGDLAAVLGWTAERADRVVADLLADGLAVASAERPDAVRAVEPAIALPALTARRFRGRPGDRLADPAGIARLGVAGPVGPAALAGLDEAAACVERLVAGVRGEVVQLACAHVPGAPEFSRQVAEAVLSRGAALRPVWSSAVLAEPAAAEHAAWLAARWAAPRVVDAVPMRATVVDGVVAVVHDERGKAGVIRAGRALGEIGRIADRLWERGVAVTPPPAKSEPGAADSRNELVLRLLADGLTDDAIARRVGVSVRTVRNDVAGTMARLKARSRFQAGVRAVQLGLI